MHDCVLRIDNRAIIALPAALILAMSLMCCVPSAKGAGPRAVTSHVVVGLVPNSGFTVKVNGEELPSSPLISGDLGIVSFEVDESTVPGPPYSVVIGDPGDLVISDVRADAVTESSAVVHWTTNLPSNSIVRYGETSSYEHQSPTDPALVMTHELGLTGLVPGTTYHFSVTSDDGQGHAASSPDYTFETLLAALTVTGVRVDSVGQTWATVSWQTNRPADSRIEYGIAPTYGSSTPLDSTLVVTHSVTLSGLVPGTVYHMRAHSDDGLGSSAVSGDHEFETVLPALSIEGVHVAAAGTTWAAIRWTTNRAADSRVEYGSTESYGSSTSVDTTMSTEHEVTLAGLEPGATYHYRTWSADGQGETISSDDGTFETEPPPLGVWDVAVTQVGQTWAVVAWLTDRPATSRVEYGETEAYGDSTSSGTGFVTEHSATLSGLAEGTLHHFRVKSVDEDGHSGSSPDSTFSTLEGEPTGPPQIDDVGYDVASVTSVLVTWTTDRPATSQVRYGTGGEIDGATRVDSTEVLEHSVLVWPVVPRALYSFVAVSACGADTTYCQPMSFVSVPPPGQDSELRPVEIIKLVVDPDAGNSAVVVWACDRPCSSWVDYGQDLSYGSTVPGVPLGEAAYSAELGGLVPGSIYHFRINVWDLAAGEAVGEDVTFQTALPPDEVPPSPPCGLGCTLSYGGVDVSWDDNDEPDLLGYNVYRVRSREDELDWSRAEMLNATPIVESRFFDPTVESGRSYVYAVSAVDDSGNESGFSESVAVDVGEGYVGSLRFAAYPNPVRDHARFVFTLPDGVASARLRVISITGRVVMEKTASAVSRGEQTLTWDGNDPTGWPAGEGVYLCELVAGDSIARRKLTVLR